MPADVEHGVGDVEADHAVAGVEETRRQVEADEAGGAGDEDGFGHGFTSDLSWAISFFRVSYSAILVFR